MHVIIVLNEYFYVYKDTLTLQVILFYENFLTLNHLGNNVLNQKMVILLFLKRNVVIYMKMTPYAFLSWFKIINFILRRTI